MSLASNTLFGTIKAGGRNEGGRHTAGYPHTAAAHSSQLTAADIAALEADPGPYGKPNAPIVAMAATPPATCSAKSNAAIGVDSTKAGVMAAATTMIAPAASTTPLI
jgi:hypothetical protein